MLLYTIVPLEQLLEGWGQDRYFLTVEREGVTMEVEPIGGATGSIVRVMSSDPQAYLDARWQPGCRITLSAEESGSLAESGRRP